MLIKYFFEGKISDESPIGKCLLGSRIGDVVKIISGSLQGFGGNVSTIDTDRGVATVVVSILGRNTPVEVGLDQVVFDK